MSDIWCDTEDSINQRLESWSRDELFEAMRREIDSKTWDAIDFAVAVAMVQHAKFWSSTDVEQPWDLTDREAEALEMLNARLNRVGPRLQEALNGAR